MNIFKYFHSKTIIGLIYSLRREVSEIYSWLNMEIYYNLAMTYQSDIASLLTQRRANNLAAFRESLKLNPFERVVAYALRDAISAPEQADPLDFQSFRENIGFYYSQFGHMTSTEAELEGRLPVLRSIIANLARWMVIGPSRNQICEGPNGRFAILARLSGVINGPDRPELPSGYKLEIEVLQYFIAGFYESDGEGGYRANPTCTGLLRCRWYMKPIYQLSYLEASNK